jgi:hypothetical protein
MKRWEDLPELEGGTSIILIQRETFPLFGTQTVLGFFEVDEGTASDLRVKVVTPGMERCRNTVWRITNPVLRGAQNGRREACSHLFPS